MTLINDVVIVRYGEIALKGPYIRNQYEKILISNISSMLDAQHIKYDSISRDWGRIYIHTDDPAVVEIAVRVFGVVSASWALTCEPTLESAALVAVDIGRSLIKKNESFAIRARRSGTHSFSSNDIGVVCGDAVLNGIEHKDIRVDLTSPDKEIFIEMRQDHGFIFTDILKGIGGLPLGTQGKMVALISGGIDSPVAAWLMMKRGCEIIPVYINNEPYSDKNTHHKAMECIRILQSWAQGRPFKVYEVPNGESLTVFISDAQTSYTCLLCRRMMYRIAASIMDKEKACGIITGVSLGQVASQTAQNLAAEICGICAPIYHPLVGLDKTEIVNIARSIGTYDASIQKAASCAAVPQSPITSAICHHVCHEEDKVKVEELLEIALSGMKKVEL